MQVADCLLNRIITMDPLKNQENHHYAVLGNAP